MTRAIADLREGIARKLALGISARVFAGEQAMLSVVSFEPDSEGSVHSQRKEQWGVLMEGSGVRIQDGIEVSVGPGDF